MINQIKKELLAYQDKNYSDFSTSLLPGVDNVIGVRLPILRKIAKNIASGDWQTFLKENDDEFFELTMLEGIVIGCLKFEYNEFLNYIEKFVPKINNWSVCDSFCCGLKQIKNNRADFKNFMEKYFNSDLEFELRFAYVILLNFYVKEELDYCLIKILEFNNDKYYSKMAAAWLLSYCFINNFNKTFEFIKNNKIHNFVLKKGITKTRESYRISKEQKDSLKQYFLD